MNPTREQIIEGRDEALEHMGIRAREWEHLAHERRQLRMTYEATRSPQKKAAALTVAIAERRLAEGLGGIAWHATCIKVAFSNPLRSTDFVRAA